MKSKTIFPPFMYECAPSGKQRRERDMSIQAKALYLEQLKKLDLKSEDEFYQWRKEKQVDFINLEDFRKIKSIEYDAPFYESKEHINGKTYYYFGSDAKPLFLLLEYINQGFSITPHIDFTEAAACFKNLKLTYEEIIQKIDDDNDNFDGVLMYAYRDTGAVLGWSAMVMDKLKEEIQRQVCKNME